MTYCYRCPSCGRLYEKSVPDYVGACENTHLLVGPNAQDISLRRSYKDENVQVDKASLRRVKGGTAAAES